MGNKTEFPLHATAHFPNYYDAAKPEFHTKGTQKLQPISRHALLRHPVERTVVEGTRLEAITGIRCCQQHKMDQCCAEKQRSCGKEGELLRGTDWQTHMDGRIPALDLISALKIIIIITTWRRSWLMHCATSRKVACSIPDCVIGIFHWYNLSGRTMALGLTKPLTEMSTRNICCGVKAAVA